MPTTARGNAPQPPVSGGCGLCPQTPETHPLPLYISGYAPESNHVFAVLISMPYFESINFYQISSNFSYFCKNTQMLRVLGAPPQTPETAPPFPLQISDYAPDTRRVLLTYFQVLESYNDKSLS